MTNFLDATTEIDGRLEQYAVRLHTIEAHLRRGERRAARARLEGFLDELVDFAREVEFPLETMVVGAQLGFFSGGGELFRGRIPGAILGMAAGWLYGQQAMQRHRLALEQLAERVALLTIMLETEPDSLDAASPPVDPGPPDTDVSSAALADRVTAEIDRSHDGG